MADENVQPPTVRLGPGEAEPPGEAPAPKVILPVVAFEAYSVGVELARGGLGRVIRADDQRLARTVAIKELLPGSSETRFVREALITARLEHPAIVPVYEAGRWPNGAPFYAMKLVQGRSLAQAIAATHSFAERLALVPKVTTVAEAIAYAHAKGVVHRDIKPANVIIGAFGETGVIDWGLAKDLTATEPSEPRAPSGPEDQTVFGDVLGTPSYMPPEQARGEPVDTRADVYAVGAVLYHVLAGVAPYARQRAEPLSVGKTLPPLAQRTAAEVITDVIDRAPVPLEKLAPQTPPDLLTIVAKAMARNPDDRYRTAFQLAEDLVRLQTGQLVSARRYSRWELAKRWLARKRAIVGVVAAALVTLSAVTALSFRRVVGEREFAERQRRLAEERSDEARQARSAAVERQNELILLQARAMLDPDPTASLAWLKQMPLDADCWRDAVSIATDAVSRGVARWVLGGHTGTVWQIAVAPDGQRFATASADGSVRLFGLADGHSLRLTGHVGEVNTLAFAPDGAKLASGGDDGNVFLWDVAGPPRLARKLAGPGRAVLNLVYAPNGGALIWVTVDGAVHVWDLHAEKERLLGSARTECRGLAVLPDSTGVIVSCNDRTVALWSLAGGARRVLAELSMPRDVAIAPDGKTAIVAGARDRSILLVSLEGGPLRTLTGHTLRATSVAMSPDGTMLVSGGEDRSVRIWNLRHGTSRVFRGHDAPILAVAFAAGGRVVVSAGLDRTIRVWPVNANDERLLTEQTVGGRQAVFAPHGGRLATDGGDGKIRIWELPATDVPRLLNAQGIVADSFAFTPDGRSLVAASDAGRVHVWDVATGAGRTLAESPTPIRTMALSPNGTLVAWGTADGRLRLRSLAADGPRAELAVGELEVLAFEPRGERLYFSSSAELRSCLVAHCAETVALVERQTSFIRSVAVAPDGTVAVGGAERRLHLIDDRSGRVRILNGPETTIQHLVFARDGSLVAGGSFDGAVTVWDIRTGGLRTLGRHRLEVTGVALSPDAKQVATSSLDQTVRVWDLATGTERVLRGHDDAVQAVAFAPDGQTLASVGLDRPVRLWPARSASSAFRSRAEFNDWLQDSTTAFVGTTGVVMSP